MMPPQLPPGDLLALGHHIQYGRHDPVERRRAHSHHDPDGFFGDETLRPDPVWMILRKARPLRPLTALATRIGAAFSNREQHREEPHGQRRDVPCVPERS